MSNRFLVTELNGIQVLVETTVLPGTEQTSSGNDMAEKINALLLNAQTAIEYMANATAETVRRVATRSKHPDQLELQFGIKFSTQGHIIFASAASEASLNVKVVYARSEMGADTEDVNDRNEEPNSKDECP